MSWLFSQALVEEFSAATCSAGEPSAQLNVMPTPHKFSRQDKTMEPSDLSRFGLTFAVLTEDRGEALLTWYRAGFRAKTSAQQALARELMASDPAYGGKWVESSVRYDPASSTWRTHLCLWDEALQWSSVTLPKWGMTRAGVLWEPTTLPRLMSASASGLWPTPTASLGTKGGRVTPRKGREGGTLIEAVSARMYATPTARDWRSGKASQETMDRNSRPLSEQVGGLLNPTWVEWLMGWPIGWTALQPLATAKFREWQQQHSIFSANESEVSA